MPSVEFIFRNGGEASPLYILDIKYEVHVKWSCRKKTPFVFDDIAGSSDYMNKFAINDFLEDVTKADDTNFLTVMFTRNFDFLTTNAIHGICPPHQCRLAFRAAGEIKLYNFDRSDIQNPFYKLQNRLT